MQAKLIKCGVVLLLIGAGMLWYWHTHTPQAIIRRRISSLAECVSKSADEGNGATAYKLLVFENMLDDSVNCQLLDFPYNGTNSANTFASLVFRGRGVLKSAACAIKEAECSFSGNGTAVVVCAVQVKLNYNGQIYDEVRYCRISMIKRERDWKIAGFKDADILKK